MLPLSLNNLNSGGRSISMSNNENKDFTPDDIIKKIKCKSANGDYIYRGERKLHCKVSSALYREHMNIYKRIKKHEYIEDHEYISIVLKDYDLRVSQRQILNTAKNHIGETPQDIYEDYKDAPADHQKTILKADEIEILTELQHYGGKINLIDFTTDYLIAIYFACAGESTEAGRVILVEKTQEIESMIIRPYNPRHRVVAQKSMFLYPPKGLVDVPDVNIVTIPAHLKQEMITYLRKYHDISAEKIYNDLHGFITHQNIQRDSKIQFHLGLAFHRAGLDANSKKYKEDFYKEAIKHYGSAIELNSEDSDSYYNRGECLLHLRKLDRAKEDIKIAKAMGLDVISAFRNEYKNVADFEEKTWIKMCSELAEMPGN